MLKNADYADGYMDGYMSDGIPEMQRPPMQEDMYSFVEASGQDTRHDDYGADPGSGNEVQEHQYPERSQTTADGPRSYKYIPRNSQQDVKSLQTPHSSVHQSVTNPVEPCCPDPAGKEPYGASEE